MAIWLVSAGCHLSIGVLQHCRLQEGPRLASFVAWALPRAAGVRELTVRFTNHHQAMKFQARRRLPCSGSCHHAAHQP